MKQHDFDMRVSVFLPVRDPLKTSYKSRLELRWSLLRRSRASSRKRYRETDTRSKSRSKKGGSEGTRISRQFRGLYHTFKVEFGDKGFFSRTIGRIGRGDYSVAKAQYLQIEGGGVVHKIEGTLHRS